jgi:peptidoglycan/xylan/chitin deacetylase (PgdA/CDA1 family)
MRKYRPCPAVRFIYPQAVLRFRTTEKEACLTFDDGPDPLSTPQILEALDKHKIKAIFFCSGIQAGKYPDLMERIIIGGHVTGNHGYRHLNGFRHTLKEYTGDVMKASADTSSFLFRPPYGFLRPRQYLRLKRDFRIILWDVMAYDFDPGFGIANMSEVLRKKVRPGSIIVLHDKPSSMAMEILEDFLLFAEEEGYRFILPGFVRPETGTPR